MKSNLLLVCSIMVALVHANSFILSELPPLKTKTDWSVLPMLPLPQAVVSTGGNVYRVTVPSSSQGGLVLPAGCASDTACSDLLAQAFDHSITATFQKQLGLSRWRLSLHPEKDAPVPPTPTSSSVTINSITISLNNTVVAQEGFTVGDDESYDIIMDAPSTKVVANTVWGVLRAFESLAQLFQYDGTQFVAAKCPLHIHDYPRFKWRGLMVDTSRHFQTLNKLLHVVDAISAMKLNVLHLHLTDAQSFSFEIKSHPDLSGKGSYHPKAVYSQNDLRKLMDYAKYRGVVVVPEVDMPAHTGSWRFGYPQSVADCSSYVAAVTYGENLFALNPANQITWNLIDDVVGEMSTVFDSSIIHVGGDEVNSRCWSSAPEAAQINQWMSKNGLSDYNALNKYFDEYTQKAVTNGKRPMVWEDVYSANATVNENTIVHVWRSLDLLAEVVKQGYDAVLSYGFYVDRQVPVDGETHWLWAWTHRDWYAVDPVLGLNLSPEDISHVLGGELCSWDESTDDYNFDGRALGRSASGAERFWSAPTVTDPDSVEIRTNRFRCIAVRRGISTQGPLSPDWCETALNN